MSSKGRGNLFKLLLDTDSSTSSSGNERHDSGFGAGEISQPSNAGARGNVLEDLVSSTSSMTLRKGRGQLFQFMSSESMYSTNAGRVSNVLEQAASSSSSEEKPLHTGETAAEPKQKTDRSSQRQDTTYFCPQTVQGREGSTVQLHCNYIALNCDRNKGVYMYEVRFHPNVDSANLRMKYLNQHREALGNVKTFDGITLYLPILLKERLTTFVSKSVADESDIEVRIMYKRQELLKDCVHLYNVLFDRVMKSLSYVRFDRKQFDPTNPKMIPQAKLEIWPGYVTAVDEYDGGLMLCCDVSHRVLCQKTVRDMLGEIYQRSSNNFQINAKKALIGSIIITRYNNRTYRVDDIDFDKSPKSTFPARQGIEVSYLNYYRTNYNITIRDENQPLILSIKCMRKSGTNEKEEIKLCLVPELCYLTGLSDEMRADFRLMREISSHTRVTPNQRMQALQKFYQNVTESPDARQILESWGLSLKASCQRVSGRQLREEVIQFAASSFTAGPSADFSKYAMQNEMLDVVNIRNWIIFHTKNNTTEAKSFCAQMERCTKALGMNNLKPQIVVLENDRTDTYVHALRKNITNETQIVVCIQPTSRDDRYAAIKKLLCVDMPIPSQVINAKTLGNETKNRSICQKIALQMNCKLGGTLWTVKIPFKSVMICGIDSYHDAAQKSNSVAAFVSSLNAQYTRWHSKAVVQTKREEIVSGLCSAFISALHAYQNHNKKLPEGVIIYRDGVGDGQLPLCSNYEIPQFEDAVKKAFGQATIKITFIVVQKRINTKFFVESNKEYCNPQPGTILDHCVTRRSMYDFFLVSQFVKQGTVTPSHYIVLRDDANYDPSIIQRLTYKLCFLYYNWPGTIRTPACCQYAHKMAYLIGQSVRKAPAEELLNKLFYL